MKKFKLLFIADPLENFDPVAETTLYMMREAQKRGHQVWYAQAKDLSLEDQEVQVQASQLSLKSGKDFYRIIKRQKSPALKFNAILLRKDPPFDIPFLEHLHLLARLEGQIYLGNRPSGLMLANEKLFALEFADFVPPTLVSSQKEEILKFIQKQKQGAIIKPLNQAGGRGVYYLKSAHAENLNLILENATQGYQRHLLVQSYLPAAKKGDKRILLLNGEILGSFRRIPAKGEHRANLHSGGQAKPCSLSTQEKNLVESLRSPLEKRGLDFVGLDLIDEYLIEINTTSPMGLHELKELYGKNFSKNFVNFLETKINLNL
ncbi:MAG: glutathione synthase [Deltaproteobacteria bacterium]|nr:glutathione synthase [Deltaproteobacteria bacterium]